MANDDVDPKLLKGFVVPFDGPALVENGLTLLLIDDAEPPNSALPKSNGVCCGAVTVSRGFAILPAWPFLTSRNARMLPGFLEHVLFLHVQTCNRL